MKTLSLSIHRCCYICNSIWFPTAATVKMFGTHGWCSGHCRQSMDALMFNAVVCVPLCARLHGLTIP